MVYGRGYGVADRKSFGTHRLVLREDQTAAIDELGAGILAGYKRQIAFGPTGSGKTEMAAMICDMASARGSRVVFLADRLPLVRQASLRFAKYGIRHGIVQGKTPEDPEQLIQVCSAQTVEAREFSPHMSLLIIDEAHSWREKVIDFLMGWDGPVIGLSATPLSKGLGKIYSRVVNTVSANALLAKNLLSPLRVYEMREIDMSGEPVGTGGEWTASQVRRRSGELIGEMVLEWERMTLKHFGGPVKSLVFSADIEDGALISEAFVRAGYDFRQSTYHDSFDETVAMLEGFERNEFLGLVSVDRFTKGFDVPTVQCIIGARPYASSLINFLQQLGRGMRASEGKDYCLYLDFAGNFSGWYDAVMDYWEEGVSSLSQRERMQPTRKEGMERTSITCLCGLFVNRRDGFCVGCGRRVRRPTSDERRVVRGRLEELAVAPGSRKWMENKGWTWIQICRVATQIYRQVDHARMRGFALAQYKNLYDEWPRERFKLDYAPADKRVERRIFRHLRAYKKKDVA